MNSQSEFKPSPFERLTLANGLEVLLCRDADLPVVTCMLWYRVGSACESPGNTGVSHFLEHMLFKGSRQFAKGEIDKLTLSCGGSNNAFTWLDATAYYFSLPASDWELALRIEADRMQGALLDADEIEAERQVILEEWQSAQDDPDELFWDSLNALALERHPYRYPVLGWPEDIRGLTRESLLAHYRRYYHPNLATLVLVGDLPQNAAEVIEKHLGALPAGPAPPTRNWQEPAIKGQKRLWMPRPDVQLPRMVVCWPAPALTDPDYAPLLMLQHLLSEGASSRLHQALVEERHLASDVLAILFETRDPYLFWIQLDLSEKRDTAEVEAALFAEIEKIRTYGLEAAELGRIRNQLLKDFYLNQETTEDRAEFAGEMLLAGSWDLLNEYHQRLEAVTAADIQRVAAEWLGEQNRTIGWLWPEGEPEQDEGTPAEASRPAAAPRRHHRHEPGEAEPALSTTPQRRLPELAPLRTTLANGMTSLIHARHKTPTVSLLCWLPAGSDKDQERQGLANLTLASLIKGTQQRSGRAFAEALEALGADLSLNASLTGVSLEIDTLAAQLDPVLELLRETLLEPAFAPEEVAKEKRLILADLQMALESSGYQANAAFLAEVYGGSVAARIVEGTPESVAALGAEDVKDFYARHYGPSGLMLTMAGDVDTSSAAAALEKHFGAWVPQRREQNEIPQLQRQQRFVYRHLPLPGRDQCTLLLGHLGVERQHPDYPALLLLDVILGNGPGFAARIPRHLRDELGLAYYINYSALVGSQLWPGAVQGLAETSPDKALDCVRGMLHEIRALQLDGVTAAELEAARAYLSGRFLFMFETNAQRSGYLLQQQIYGWPDDFLNSYLQKIQAVSREDIQRVAQLHLDTHHYTLISAGPRPHWDEETLSEL